jgi:hypothetical protein
MLWAETLSIPNYLAIFRAFEHANSSSITVQNFLYKTSLGINIFSALELPLITITFLQKKSNKGFYVILKTAVNNP